jgi:NADPH:quinone reductase-like Zn-dependent oxidoreductase
VLDLLEVGAVSPSTVQAFALRDAAEAHREAAMRHVAGKLVLTTSLEGER